MMKVFCYKEAIRDKHSDYRPILRDEPKKSKRFAQEATIMKSNDYRQLGC